MGESLKPSIWTSAIFKNFLRVSLKATIFEKFTFTVYINRNFILCPPFFIWLQVGDHRLKLVAAFLSASPLGEQTGENISVYIVVASRSEKLSSFPVPVASCRPNFPPVWAAFLSPWQAAYPIILRSGQLVSEAEFTSWKWRVDEAQLLKG
jgi:hypothetical protein